LTATLDPKHIGKRYGPYRYVVGVEKVKEFAFAVAGGIPSAAFGAPPEGLNPLFYDPPRLAFPTFAVTFAIQPFVAAVTDPVLEINVSSVVHGEQEFEFLEPIRPHDTLLTVGWISQIYEKGRNDFLIVTTESTNQNNRLVVRAVWTAIARRS